MFPRGVTWKAYFLISRSLHVESFGLPAVVWTHRAHCCLRLFAFAFPSTFHALPLISACLTLSLLPSFCWHVFSSERPFLSMHCKILILLFQNSSLSSPLPNFIFPLGSQYLVACYTLIDLLLLPLKLSGLHGLLLLPLKLSSTREGTLPVLFISVVQHL